MDLALEEMQSFQGLRRPAWTFLGEGADPISIW